MISFTKIYDSRAFSVLNRHPYIVDKSLRDFINEQISTLNLPKLLWNNLVHKIEIQVLKIETRTNQETLLDTDFVLDDFSFM